MFCRVLLLLFLLPFSVLLGGERLIPGGYDFEVQWQVNKRVYGLSEALEITAEFSCTEGREGCALEWNMGTRKLGEKREWYELDGEIVVKAFQSAARGENFESKGVKGDDWIRYVTYPGEGGLGVRLTRREKMVEFSPERVRAFLRMVEDVQCARAWYEKLMVAEEVPEWTKQARPPATDQIVVTSRLGMVEAGELRLFPTAYYYVNSQRAGSGIGGDVSYGEKRYKEPRPAGILVNYLARLKSRIEAGSVSNFPLVIPQGRGVKFLVATNQQENYADIEMVEGDRRVNPFKYLGVGDWSARLKEEQLIEMDKIAQKSKLHHQWMEEHMHLFYEPKKRMLADDLQFEVKMKVQDGEEVGAHVHLAVGAIRPYSKQKVEMSVTFPAFTLPDLPLGDDEVTEFVNACIAANKQQNYHAVVRGEVPMEIEAEELYGVWTVKVKRGNARVVYSPQMGARLIKLMDQAKVARKWYSKLHGLYDLPDESEEACPSGATGTELVLKVGSAQLAAGRQGRINLEGRVEQTLGGEVQVVKEFVYHQGSKKVVLGTALSAELQPLLREALQATKQSEVYMNGWGDPDGEHFSLEVDEREKIIDFTYVPEAGAETLHLTIDYGSPQRVLDLLENVEKTGEWLGQNQKLFFRQDE